MKRTTKLLVLVAAVVGALSMAGVGWAFWTAGGSGSASATVGTLNPPTGVTTTSTAGSGTVHVAWVAPTAGVTPGGYYVRRYDGSTPSDACGTSPGSLTTAAAISCNDSSVPNGSYTYTVTAIFKSWTAVSAASSPAVPVSNGGGPLDHFTVTAPGTATAGITFTTVSVTASDTGGQPASGWTSTTQCVTLSGPGNSPNNSSPAYPPVGGCAAGQSSLAFNSSGQATGLAFILKKAETTSLTVTASSKTGHSGAIVVSDAGVDHLVVGAPASGTAGTAITGISLTAQDLYNNVAKGYGASQTITWTGPANSPAPAGRAPTLPAATVSFTNGVSTTTLSATLYNAASNILIATDATAKTGSATITVADAGVHHLVVGAPASGAAGTAITGISLTGQDLYNNVAKGYGASQTITWTGPANSPAPASRAPTLPAATVSFTNGVSTTTLSATLYNAAVTTLTATDTGGRTGSATITVADAGVDHLVVGAPASGTAGTAITGISLTAQDLYNNTATSYAAGSHAITWSGPLNSPGPTNTAPLLPSSPVSFTNGVSTTALSATLYKAGPNTLTATDTGSKTGSATITVSAAAVPLTFGVCPSTVVKNSTWTSTISRAATDQWSNPDPTRSTALSVTLSHTGGGGTVGGPIAIAATNLTSASSALYNSPNGNYPGDTVTAHVATASTNYTNVSCTFLGS